MALPLSQSVDPMLLCNRIETKKMSKSRPLLALAILLLGAHSASAAVDPANPDWPCVQKKIENLSPASIWDGPSIDEHKDWFKDKEIATLVKKLASRRVPVERATEALETYAKALPQSERDAKLARVFAGLFDTVNTQRRTVVSGIEKYQRAQKERAAELEKQGVDLANLQGDLVVNDPDVVSPSPEEEKLYWAGRIFQERQANLSVACELPAIIEERLFTMSRAIRALMSK